MSILKLLVETTASIGLDGARVTSLATKVDGDRTLALMIHKRLPARIIELMGGASMEVALAFARETLSRWRSNFGLRDAYARAHFRQMYRATGSSRAC